MEEIKLEEFSISHGKIREAFIFELSKTLKADAMRHIQRGFIMRFNMMESAINELYSKVGKSDKPLSSYLAVDLSLLLNAYYLNLTGSLDNIAWALTYHHSLINSINENDFNQQRLAQLTGNNFILELRKKNLQKLADELLLMGDWCKSVKRFRNPAAHNIPLYVPHTIFSERDAKKHKELDRDAAELIKDGKREEGMNLFFESYNLGKHYPVFITEFPQKKIYELPKKINEDHENWLKIIEIVFKFGFGIKFI